MPHLCRHKIDVRYIRAGIIARAALYRIPEWEPIDRFLAAKNRAATCTFSVHDKEYGYWPDHLQFIPSPHKFRLSIGVDLEADGRQIAERIIFPLTSPLTSIGKSIPSDSDIDDVASEDWKIYLLSGREFGPSTLQAMLPTAPIDIHACHDEVPSKP